ncbi:MAG: hypothetical protein IPN32_39175 [Deltaproteobacteria bacterium]|nr:hypothetical protein [Deltaproteobacteria bacterium]
MAVSGGEIATLAETYPCRSWCGLGTTQPQNDQRRDFRCALPGFDESRWRNVPTPRMYMGRLPIYDPGPEDDVRPDESPETPRESHDDGCPGAWYRCAFVASLAKYERLLLEHGFASNLLADRTHDRLVIEAMQYIESERVRAQAHWHEIRSKAAAQ